MDGIKELWLSWGLTNYNPERKITRRELSVMLDKCILLFGSKNLPMDINGKIGFKISEL